MFEDLRRAFREAVDNFKDELNRESLPGTMDELLKGMVQEVTDAKARLKGLETDLRLAEEKVAAEEEHVATNRRRAEMALEIGDEETARIAAEFLQKHETRLGIFQEKAAVLKRERQLLDAEVTEMMAKLKEARANRASITAQSSRTGAREALGESADLFAAMDRMEARIEGTEYESDAAQEIGREFGTASDDMRVDVDAPA